MKECSIPYCKVIPTEWQEIPNRYLFEYHSIKVGEHWKDYQLLSLTTSGVKEKDINASGGKVPDSYDKYQTVEPDDMIFCLFDLDVSAVFSGLSHHYGMITSAYDVVRPNHKLLNQGFSDYWFQYVFSNRYYKMYSKNIRYTITSEMFKAIKTPIPPMTIQKKIADFLDKKSAEIDKLIEIENQQIEKLKEYKQAVITEAVTKGLDKSAPMKDSGVDWIGEIPEGWKVLPLKCLFETGKGLSITKADLVEEGIKVISYGQIHAKYNNPVSIDDRLFRFVPEIFLKTNPECLVKESDFIFADTSEDVAGSGDFIYIDKEDQIFAGYHSLVLKSKNSANYKYLAYLFMSQYWKRQIQCKVSGVKLFSISRSILLSTSVIIPSTNEQKEIVGYLDNICNSIDNVSSIKQKKIDELNDYKKSLIYEYVTGKKEVV